MGDVKPAMGRIVGIFRRAGIPIYVITVEVSGIGNLAISANGKALSAKA